MSSAPESFLERFSRFGAAPGVGTYLALFHPRATLFDSGMERPIAVPEIPAHLEAILRIAPDFRMTPMRWRERGGTVFVEASNRATLAGSLATWPSTYCVDLEGDLVIRGRRYYDRRPLFARLDPSLPGLPGEDGADSHRGPLPETEPEALVKRLAQAWAATQPTPPPHHRRLARALPGLRLDLLTWAGDGDLVFVEWQGTADLGGAPLAFGLADRIEPRVPDARAYFDTLALGAALATHGVDAQRETP